MRHPCLPLAGIQWNRFPSCGKKEQVVAIYKNKTVLSSQRNKKSDHANRTVDSLYNDSGEGIVPTLFV